MRKGVEAVEQAATRSGGKTPFFKWSSGESKILHFLTDGDELITAYTHFVKPNVKGGSTTFVCRKEDCEVPGCVPEKCTHVECELCNSPKERVRKRSQRTFGIAVWRMEKKDETGKVTGTKDLVRDVEGAEVPYVGIVSQSPQNFWPTIVGVYRREGSILDVEFDVQRRGSDMNDTTYVVIPIGTNPIKDMQKRYEEFLPDLQGMLNTQVSAAFYAKWLHGVSGDSGEAEEEDPGQQDETLDEETEFARLRAQREALAGAAVAGGGSYQPD